MSSGSAIHRPPIRSSAAANRMHPHTNNNRGAVSTNMSRQKNQDANIDIKGVYSNPRFTFSMTSLIGMAVRVKVQNGKLYEGIFKTFSPELEVVLECVHLIDSSIPNYMPSKDRILEKLVVNFNDVVTMEAANVDPKFGETASETFTDSAIGKSQVNGSVREEDYRPLVKWDGGDSQEPELEGNSRGWTAEEMFKRNEEKYGIKSSYDDSMDEYTTKLNTSSSEYQKRRAQADYYAAQIEGSATSQANRALEDGDRTEEDKFSAVVRQSPKPESSDQRSRYIPPGQRTSSGLNQHRSAATNSHLSQSARFNNREPPRRDSDRRHKPNQQTANQGGDVQRLKDWSSKFNMNTQNDSAANTIDNKSPPKHTASPNVAGGKTNQVTAPVSEERVVKVVATDVSSTPNVSASTPTLQSKPTDKSTPSHAISSTSTTSPAVNSQPVSATTPAVTSASTNVSSNPNKSTDGSTADAISSTEPESSKSSTTTTPPEVKGSNLNPEAKEFVYIPKPTNPPPPPTQPAAQPPSAPMVPAPQTVTHHYPKGSKTATVSVDQARQPTRPAEMPTPQQAMGQPITMNPGAAPAVHPQQFIPVMMPPQYNARLQRVPSYPGAEAGGQPTPAHFISTQSLVHGHHQFPVVPNNMGAHMIPIQGPGNVAVPPPPNTQGHHQAPPHSHQPVMSTSHPPAGGHHMQHPQQYGNHGSAVSYVYPMPPQHGQQTQPTQPHPHPQPSPHNPSPSPVNGGAGGGVANYGNYVGPPQAQQFYQPGGNHHHQYHANQPHLVYIPGGQYPGQYPAHGYPMPTQTQHVGYHPNYPQPPPQQ